MAIEVVEFGAFTTTRKRIRTMSEIERETYESSLKNLQEDIFAGCIVEDRIQDYLDVSSAYIELLEQEIRDLKERERFHAPYIAEGMAAAMGAGK